MSGTDICEIFDGAFHEITKRLVRIELRKVVDGRKEDSFQEMGCWESIHTTGYIKIKLLCFFSEDLFHYITDTMHGGTAPPQDEVILYLNEYINIICGCALSKLNTIIEKPSRLSVPGFYREMEPLEMVFGRSPQEVLSYQSEEGELNVYFCYSIGNQQKEGEE